MVDRLVIILTNGLIVGAIYGLFAYSLVFVYKGSRILNLAQGEFGMIGAFVFRSLVVANRFPLIFSVVAALTVSAGLGVVTELTVIRRIADRHPAIPLVATLAIGGLLQVVAVDVWQGIQVRSFPPLINGTAIRVGPLFVSNQQILAVGVVGVVMALTTGLYAKTKLGLRIRAVAQNPHGAALLGVNVRGVMSIVWGLGGVLAGVAAIVVAPLVTFTAFFMLLLLARALVAAVVGGLTNLVGTFIAAIAVGVFESGIGIQVGVPGAVELVLFLVVLMALVIRPGGLFGSEY